MICVVEGCINVVRWWTSYKILQREPSYSVCEHCPATVELLISRLGKCDSSPDNMVLSAVGMATTRHKGRDCEVFVTVHWFRSEDACHLISLKVSYCFNINKAYINFLKCSPGHCLHFRSRLQLLHLLWLLTSACCLLYWPAPFVWFPRRSLQVASHPAARAVLGTWRGSSQS